MTNSRWILVSALVLSAPMLGCGTDGNSGGSGGTSGTGGTGGAGGGNGTSSCLTVRNGNYEEVIVEQAGGTCGPFSPIVTPIVDGDMYADNTSCTSDPVVVDANCTVTSSATCPNAGSTVVFTSTTTQNNDGSVLTGTLTISVTGAGQCNSVYDATYTRQ